MAEPPTPRSTALSFLGTLSASANAHEPATVAIQRVRDEAERMGVSPGFDVYSEAARIYGELSKVTYSAERLNAAPGESAITSAYVSPAPYGNVGRVSGAPRTFDVRVHYTAVEGANEVADYVTLRYTGGLPATVAELRAETEDVASSLVEGYGRTMTAVGGLEVVEV